MPFPFLQRKDDSYRNRPFNKKTHVIFFINVLIFKGLNNNILRMIKKDMISLYFIFDIASNKRNGL